MAVVCILFWKTNFIWKSKESFCVLQGDLELEPLSVFASASQVLGLQAWATMTVYMVVFIFV